VLPHALRLQALLPRKGGLQHCHVAHSLGLCLPRGRALVPPRVFKARVSTRINKRLAVLGAQLDSRVFKTRSCVTKASARHTDMRDHYSL
jgi:hypothetical protein